MKLIKRILFLSLIPAWCYATTDDELHLTAHAGATYAITHVTEVMCERLDLNKTGCTIAGIVLANGANIGYKAMQGFPSDTKRAAIGGLIGSGLAGVVITIDW